MTVSAVIARANADACRWAGEPAQYVAYDGNTYNVDVVVEDVLEPIGTDDGPIEPALVAIIPAGQIGRPSHGDVLKVGSARYVVDSPRSNDNGMWSLAIIQDTA